jgi:hypothetical protein
LTFRAAEQGRTSYAQYERFVGGIEIKAHDVAYFLNKKRVG